MSDVAIVSLVVASLATLAAFFFSVLIGVGGVWIYSRNKSSSERSKSSKSSKSKRHDCCRGGGFVVRDGLYPLSPLSVTPTKPGVPAGNTEFVEKMCNELREYIDGMCDAMERSTDKKFKLFQEYIEKCFDSIIDCRVKTANAVAKQAGDAVKGAEAAVVDAQAAVQEDDVAKQLAYLQRQIDVLAQAAKFEPGATTKHCSKLSVVNMGAEQEQAEKKTKGEMTEEMYALVQRNKAMAAAADKQAEQ